jgi:hypothetical protein
MEKHVAAPSHEGALSSAGSDKVENSAKHTPPPRPARADSDGLLEVMEPLSGGAPSTKPHTHTRQRSASAGSELGSVSPLPEQNGGSKPYRQRSKKHVGYFSRPPVRDSTPGTNSRRKAQPFEFLSQSQPNLSQQQQQQRQQQQHRLLVEENVHDRGLVDLLETRPGLSSEDTESDSEGWEFADLEYERHEGTQTTAEVRAAAARRFMVLERDEDSQAEQMSDTESWTAPSASSMMRVPSSRTLELERLDLQALRRTSRAVWVRHDSRIGFGLWAASHAGCKARFLVAHWLPFIKVLRRALMNVQGQRLVGVDLARVLPSQNDLREFVRKNLSLTEIWYGPGCGNISATYEFLLRAYEQAGVVGFDINKVPRRRSKDGFCLAIDGRTRKAFYKENAPPDDHTHAPQVGRLATADAHIESPIDNTMASNVLWPAEARRFVFAISFFILGFVQFLDCFPSHLPSFHAKNQVCFVVPT